MSFLAEFDAEMATTRRVLARVPTEKREWKPHPRSFSLGHLTQLVAWMPGWIASALSSPKLDLTQAPTYSYETTPDLVAMFDRNVADARARLQQASEVDMAKDWSLTRGEQVFMTMPRRDMVRQTINHLIHHRGQLTVYLRLVDVPIPMIYGPTADERVPGF